MGGESTALKKNENVSESGGNCDRSGAELLEKRIDGFGLKQGRDTFSPQRERLINGGRGNAHGGEKKSFGKRGVKGYERGKKKGEALMQYRGGK